jgi:glycosyltransferase involved in cell wall biosynthesis
MRVLSLTSLYPNGANPGHGVFVENRLRHLAARPGVDLRVVAPVPWFPSRHRIFGAYARFAAAPRLETRHGIALAHPRYLVVPKVGMTLTPVTLARAFMAGLRDLRRQGWVPDLIDAHYYYPDGVAAALVARRLNLPLVITARGTDLNLIPQFPVARHLIRFAARRADASITVCQALKDVLLDLGVPSDEVTVVRNGVDTAMFRPLDRAPARAALGVSGRVIASVGYLIPRKGHDLIIAALPDLPGTTLLIAGEGPERSRLEAQAARLGVAERVRFLGALPHAELPRVYSAADALVLASSREGYPNVLLEALACGTPVAATRVWGSPEIVDRPEAGRLVPERTPGAIAATLRALLDAPPERAAVRAYAETLSWDRATEAQLTLFRSLTGQRLPPETETAPEAVADNGPAQPRVQDPAALYHDATTSL